MVRFKTREELLSGFGPGSLDAAFLDADFAAWYLHRHAELGLRLATEFVPRERWNMALAVRAKDARLLVDLNRGLAQLAESGELTRDPCRIWSTVSTSHHSFGFSAATRRHLAAHPRSR